MIYIKGQFPLASSRRGYSGILPILTNGVIEYTDLLRGIRDMTRIPLLGWRLFIGVAFLPVGTQLRPADAGPDSASIHSVESLLASRSGYGAAVTGGEGGKMVLVTSDDDAGPGTLRHAVEQSHGPVWIRFARDMVIPLRSLVRVGSNVTIDGRGRKITLLYNGLAIYGSRNVIVTNIAVDGRFKGISQAINIARGARDVWIDHVDLSRFNDRLLNVKTGSTDVTVSWSKFHDHNKVMLLNNITDKNLFRYYSRDSSSRVTLHHNWFYDTVQRNPRAQFGVYHLYDNLLENWDFYGMSFSLGARALVEGNIFVNRADRRCTEPPSFLTVEGVERNYCSLIKTAGERAELPNGAIDERNFEATKQQFQYGPGETPLAYLVVRDNLYLGDAKEAISDYEPGRVPLPPYRYDYERPSADLARRIRAGAGNTLQ
jgi:pectate lyase